MTNQEYSNVLVGFKIRDGRIITGVSSHALKRATSRNFSPNQIKYILENYNISFPGTSASGSVVYMLDDEYVVVGNDGVVVSVVRRD